MASKYLEIKLLIDKLGDLLLTKASVTVKYKRAANPFTVCVTRA